MALRFTRCDPPGGVKYESIPVLITKAMKLPIVVIILAILASPASAYKIVCNPAVIANCAVGQQQASRPLATVVRLVSLAANSGSATTNSRQPQCTITGNTGHRAASSNLLSTIPGVESLLDSLAEVRAKRFKELEEEPEVRERLYRLAKVEVGGQSPDAASAFFETVFNRAVARCQTVKRAADDADYYPRVSVRGKPYSKRDEAMFGEALQRVREGSNISRLATGNASGHVGFAGGPQTYAPGTGERYGIEGPDVGWVREMVRRARSGMPEEDKRTANKNQDLIE